jgi:hypothetical protein
LSRTILAIDRLNEWNQKTLRDVLQSSDREEIVKIAKIAGIAKIGKAKTLPLINTDWT